MHRAGVAWHHGKASVQAPRHGSQGRPHTLSLLKQGSMEGSMVCSHLQQPEGQPAGTLFEGIE